MFVICIKDRLLDRHLCLNLYPCVIKVQSVSQSLSLSLRCATDIFKKCAPEKKKVRLLATKKKKKKEKKKKT